MLKSDAGIVQIKGSRIGVMAELTQLVRQLLKPDNLTLDDINQCIEIAKMTDEDLHTKLKEMKDTHKELLTDMMLSMLDDLFS